MPTEPFNLAFVDASCIHCAIYRRSCHLLEMDGEIEQSAKLRVLSDERHVRKVFGMFSKEESSNLRRNRA